MAKKKAEALQIDPESMYHVTMALPHKIGRLKFSPLYRYQVRGSMLDAIPANKIASTELIDE